MTKLGHEKLRLMPSVEPGVEVLAECGNADEAILALNMCKPDLLMLDVQMPDLDGFGVLSRLPSDIMPMVIFYNNL